MKNLKTYFNELTNTGDKEMLVPIDGVINLNKKFEHNLNLGIFDALNNVPLDITSFGTKSNEVDAFISKINENLDTYKKAIFVCDRLYFNYKLINFIHSKGLKFIIRVKGDANNVDQSVPLKRSVSNKKMIRLIRSFTRTIRIKNEYESMIESKDKLPSGKVNVTMKDDYIFITNLDADTHPDQFIYDSYKKRWNIEVFFKLLKYNFKFNQIVGTTEIDKKKSYLSAMIVTYIMRIIEIDYWNKNKVTPGNLVIKSYDKEKKTYTAFTSTVKINDSHLIRSIFKEILIKLVHGTLTYGEYDEFCTKNILIVKNKTGRHFKRYAKSCYKKWHMKGRANLAMIVKVINAHLSKNTDKLSKDLKILSKKLIKINGVDNG